MVIRDFFTCVFITVVHKSDPIFRIQFLISRYFVYTDKAKSPGSVLKKALSRFICIFLRADERLGKDISSFHTQRV